MAISSVNGIAAGLQPPKFFLKTTTTMEAAGVWTSLFYRAGIPGAATAPSPGVNGAALTTYSGQIPFANPSSGSAYLANLSCAASTAGTLLVCDRLWHNSGLSVTSLTGQSITSPTWPARDESGATSGAGVYLGMEVSTATTGTSANTVTIAYTNSAGTGSRSATFTTPASALAVDSFFIADLQAGDVGVRSVQTFTNSVSMTAGAIHLVAFRVLASIPVPGTYLAEFKDFADLGLPVMYSNSVPFLLWLPSTTTATTIQGQLTYAHG